MELPFSLIQVFDDPANDFLGNISAVMLLNDQMDDDQMQAIARDLNQPATTFMWPAEEELSFHIRWFAPDGEIGLCGHGSMAAIAYLVEKAKADEELHLIYRKGKVSGKHGKQDRCSIYIDPIPVLKEIEAPKAVKEGLGVPIEGYFTTGNKQIVLVSDEKTLRNMKPDFARLRESDIFGYSVTAPGDEADFVSRTIVPHVKQLEDHATGSSHAALVPFWAERLNKKQMLAYQLSPRKGKFWCDFQSEQVELSGQYSILAEGTWL